MFTAPHFQNHDAAREYLEALRWGGERACPHCGTLGKSYATKKAGVYRCASKECRKDFTVTTKSVMEFQPHQIAHLASGFRPHDRQ